MYNELLDYRRQVAKHYRLARDSSLAPKDNWLNFRKARDQLFLQHPQSALTKAQKQDFTGLEYFDYDASLRYFAATDTDVEPEIFNISLRDDGLMHIKRFAQVHFDLGGLPQSLSLFWVMAYGGGVFLPFGDVTNNDESFGGGRYLLDTIKHADLGSEDGKLVLDFNFAYNPSCAYNANWHCPLSPSENRLKVAIRAGEKRF